MPLFRFLKQCASEFGRDKAGQLSAALAYTSIFAIAPLLLVVISVIGAFFGEKAVQGQLFGHLQDYVGPNAANTIQNAIVHIHNSQHNGIALTVGLVGALFAAAALTSQLQNAFDVIFSVIPDPDAGWKQTVYIKLKNAAVLIIGSLVMAVSVLVSALITGLGRRLQDQLGVPEQTLQVINIGASLAIFVLMLYLIYRVLPDVKLPRKVVFWTSLLVGLLFLVGKVVLGVVIGRNGTATAYGAAASLITLLLWFYYTGQILFIGAEGMKVYLNNRGYVYKAKKYTLRQKTVNIGVKNNMSGQATERFAHGFTKKIRTPKK
jgi:membrane protein